MKGLLNVERDDMDFVEAAAEPTRSAKLVARLRTARKILGVVSGFHFLLLCASAILSIRSSPGSPLLVLIASSMLVEIVGFAYVDILIKVLKVSQRLGAAKPSQ